jgi:putative transposase
MTIRNELIDELLAGQDPSSVMRQDGLLGELKKALLNRLMAAEFEHHLAEDRALGEGKNHRNGSTRKRVLTDDSHVEVTIPRDREARFDPVLIGKYQRRLPGFDDKVISLYTRGMSTREIQGHLEEIYGAEVSPQLISTVTDAVASEVAEWQSRPLEPLYPVMFFDAIRVKVRDLALLSNSGPGVLANFGPPPVLQPTVPAIGSGGLLWTGKPKWICSSSSVGSMSLGSARSPV